MAHLLPPGLTPNEAAFLCEMELVTVIPRQKLNSIALLGGTTPPLTPPFPTALPLWLALLLKKQKRANIQPPPWLSPVQLQQILDFETDDRSAEVFSPAPRLGPLPASSTLDRDPDEAEYLHPPTALIPAPPFLKDASTSRAQPDALPYHWLEMGHLLLTHAADDFPTDDANRARQLLQDLREVRASKLRRGFGVLDAGAAVKMNGVGAMEVAEVRGFVGGVIDGLRRINRSREETQREAGDGHDYDEDGLGRSSAFSRTASYDDDEDEMQL